MDDRYTEGMGTEGAVLSVEDPVQESKGGQNSESAKEGAAREDTAGRGELLDRREAEVLRRELRAGMLERLSEKGLPSALAELLDYSGADACERSLDAAEKAFRAAVQAGITERLKGAAPRTGQAAPPPGKGTYAERALLYLQDRQKYQALYDASSNR